MTEQDRASLKRNKYSVFQENYFNPNSSFLERLTWGLLAIAAPLVLLLAFSLFAGALSWGVLAVIFVFLIVAFSLGNSPTT